METKFVEQLFFDQIKSLTRRTVTTARATKSFNYQFSDAWFNM